MMLYRLYRLLLPLAVAVLIVLDVVLLCGVKL